MAPNLDRFWLAHRLAPIEWLAREAAANRRRWEALVETLQSAGVLSREALMERAVQVWRRDFNDLATELWERLGMEDEGKVCLDCGASCCKSSVIVLSPSEATVLWERGQELSVNELEINATQGNRLLTTVSEAASEKEWLMPAYPCRFLSAHNLCRVYADRPDHCRYHPRYWRPDCPLSHRWYYRETSLPRQPLSDPPLNLLERLAQRKTS